MHKARILIAELFGLAVAGVGNPARAEPMGETPPILLAQLSKAVPPAQLPVPPAPERENAIGGALSCSAVSGISPKYSILGDSGHGKAKTSLSCDFSPSPRWTIQATANLYPVAGQQAPWESDFNYDIAYKINGSLTLEYADEDPNRWHRLGVRDFTSGALWLTYKLPLPTAKASLPLPLRSLDCSVAAAVQPGDWDHGRSFQYSAACDLDIAPKLSANLTAHFYSRHAQEAWDPDFTYSLSYQVSDTFSVGYANDSGNRWFGHSGGDGGLKRGTFYVAYAFHLSPFRHAGGRPF